MVINTNSSASTSSRLLGEATGQLSKSLARLSAGSRIVSPEDDSAGLAQSIKFDAQIHRNQAASTNVINALSFSQTQDGELTKLQKALDRYNELTVLALDPTKTSEDIQLYQAEANQTFSHILSSLNLTFNGVSLFRSDADLSVITDSDGTVFAMPRIDLLTSMTPILASGGVVGSAQNVAEAKETIEALATLRAQVGANIARLKMTHETLSVLNENLGAANSRIVDTDVAQESTQFARYNILTQSGSAMLAQANALPQSVLRLLG